MESNRIKHNDQTRNILNKHFFKLFGEIDEETKSYIESTLEWSELKRDEYLFKQDDAADGLYTVLLGKLEAVIETPGTEKLLGYINPSETVGEMALISGDTRSASVRCFRNATLVKMSTKVFEELCAKQPSFALNIAKIIVKRLKVSQNVRKEKQVYNNIAFYRADMNQETNSCLSLLMRLYTKDKDNYVFNIISFKKRFAIKPDVEIDLSHKQQINTWLNELEFDYNRIILDLRGFSNEVRRFLLDYCDLCIIFKTFGRDPLPSSEEQSFYDSMQHSTQKMRLILCHHMRTKRPSRTVDWLASRPAMPHTHIQHGNTEDINRMYRNLTGNSIALVLGGGGAKGIAHLGVLRALKESNIPIDYICGTDMGSMVAALYALNNDTELTIKTARELFMKNPTPKSDLNIIPKRSFYKGKRIDEIFDSYFKDVDIEDLWLPFFAVSSNITNPQMHILNKGSVKDALLASTAVPGLFPPIVIDNEIHVDGGIFSNVPIDIMMQENIGTLIACRVNKDNSKPDSEAVEIPGIITTFMKSMMAYSDSFSDHLQQYVDIYFEPETDEYGLLDWKSTEELIQLGYEHASKVLEDIDTTTLI